MAKFIMDFINKVTKTTETKPTEPEYIPPLYEPKSTTIGRYNDHSVGYQKLGPCNGMQLKLPNGETLNYIVKYTKDNGKLP